MNRPSFREEGHEQESAREYADRKALWIGIQRGDIKPPRPIETIKTVVVKEKADLSDTLERMEAAAARAAQPGANIPKLHPDLVQEQEAGETDAETNSRLKAELVRLYGANAWQANGGPEMTDEQKARRDYLQGRVWGGI